MSRKTREGKQALEGANRLTLRKRRWVLGVHILFLLCVVLGSQGPWYTAVHEEKELWTVSGPEFVVRSDEDQTPSPTDGIEGVRMINTSREPGQVEEPGFMEQPGRLAAIVLFAAIGAFFFASFNLVADADIQWPILIASVLVCLAAGKAFHSIYAPQRTLGEIIEEVEGPRRAAAVADPTGVAAVDSADLDQTSILDRLPRLRFEWGASLLFAAAPLLVLISVYLTFFAARTPPERP